MPGRVTARPHTASATKTVPCRTAETLGRPSKITRSGLRVPAIRRRSTSVGPSSGLTRHSATGIKRQGDIAWCSPPSDGNQVAFLLINGSFQTISFPVRRRPRHSKVNGSDEASGCTRWGAATTSRRSASPGRWSTSTAPINLLPVFQTINAPTTTGTTTINGLDYCGGSSASYNDANGQHPTGCWAASTTRAFPARPRLAASASHIKHRRRRRRRRRRSGPPQGLLIRGARSTGRGRCCRPAGGWRPGTRRLGHRAKTPVITRGDDRNRTGVDGFAGPLRSHSATSPSRPSVAPAGATL